MVHSEREITRCPCEKCGGVTDHEILHSDSEEREWKGILWKDKFDTIKCRGCRIVSLRHSKFLYEADNNKPIIWYIPPRLERRRPLWVDQLNQNMQDLLDEIYNALRHANLRLVAMGVRALIDAVARDKVGDQGSFEAHLAALEQEGIVGKMQKDTLKIVVDAGSAVSHRGYRPAEGLIDGMLDAVETVLNQVYINGPMLAEAKLQIPPRP